MGKGGRFLKAKVVKPKRKGRLLLTIVLVLLLLIGGAVAAAAVYYNSMLDLITRPETMETQREISDAEFEEILGYVPEKVETEPKQTETAETDPTEPLVDNIVNIMLIGQNYRKGEEHKLSDTLILCSLNKETKTLTLTSFLRDLYVQLPNYKGHICGKNRINVAYNLGWYWAGEQAGMEMLDMLMLDNFGINVDHNIEFGFNSFIQVVDALGGVDMELTADEAYYMTLDPENTGSFQAGVNHLAGDAALSYARIRSANAGDNDFNRTNRQRKVIIQILNQLRQKSIPELNTLLQTVLPLVITDMSNEEITQCALELLPMLKDLKIDTNQCPAEDTYWFNMVKLGGFDASVIECDLEKNRQILMEIAEMPKK